MKTNISKVVDNRRVIVRKPEILAPAGDLEKLEIAFHYGADAVFIGGKEYSLRSRASNFDLEMIEHAVKIAKKYSKKLYVTVNMILHNENIQGLEEYLLALEDIGVDAVICADPYVIMTALSILKKVEVHVSTQQSITNSLAVDFWYKLGCQRVVLAREVSFLELSNIKLATDCEIEYFIHGAMCSAYSGRCMLSNEMSRRDSNRGGCSQSCRWNYDVEDNELIPFSMSSKDMSLFNGIDKLIELGIDSLKIEGRMKSIHYIATVVKTYRTLIDQYCDNPDNFVMSDFYESELLKAANRPTSTGFFFTKPNHKDHLFNQREQHPSKEFVGLVQESNSMTGLVKVQQRNYFKKGDLLELVSPYKENYCFVVDELYDENFIPIEVACHPLQIIYLKMECEASRLDMIRLIK